MASGTVDKFSQNRNGSIDYQHRPLADISSRYRKNSHHDTTHIKKTQNPISHTLDVAPPKTKIDLHNIPVTPNKLPPKTNFSAVSIATATPTSDEKAIESPGGNEVLRKSSNPPSDARPHTKTTPRVIDKPATVHNGKYPTPGLNHKNISKNNDISYYSHKTHNAGIVPGLANVINHNPGLAMPGQQQENNARHKLSNKTIAMDVKPVLNHRDAERTVRNTDNTSANRMNSYVGKDISVNKAAEIVKRHQILEHRHVDQTVNIATPAISSQKIAINSTKKSTNSHTRLKFTNIRSGFGRSNHKYSKDKFTDIPALPVPKHSRIKASFKKFKKLSVRQKSGYALATLAVLLFIFGTIVNLHSFFVTRKIQTQAAVVSGAEETAGEDGRPSSAAGYSEDQPTTQAVSKYTVAPDMPKILSISSLGVLSRIVRVGSDAKTGEVGTPKNVFDTAWYDGSVKPGEKGAVFIDGHVSGPTRGGIFANLKNIKVGAVVNVTMGNETRYNYKVVATEKFDADKVDMKKVLSPYDPAKQGLNIMTCNGKYLKDAQTYDKRLVVYTVREN